MCCDAGKFEEAAVWLSRALSVNEDEPEATLCLGDLYSRSANLDDAKRCYDKICSEVCKMCLRSLNPSKIVTSPFFSLLSPESPRFPRDAFFRQLLLRALD